MSDPIQFLVSFGQAVSTMALYNDGHPARERAVDRSYRCLRDLQQFDPTPRFSFLGEETIYGETALRELGDWDWGTRLAQAGVQRMELANNVTREEYEEFLEEMMARITLSVIDSAESRPTRASGIKVGTLGIRGETKEIQETLETDVPVATISYSLGDEAASILSMHKEVQERGKLPLAEAEAVVRSLSMAMHGDSQMILPLLQLREFDEYTTTHSLNVSVLTMALAESLGLATDDVRTFGIAGLLHDLGKVNVPQDILNKPGKLTDQERQVMQQHPTAGAKLIIESGRRLDLAAAVAHEHHIMINGHGYPKRHYDRDCHKASKLVHVCDVFDALRTRRPYRDAWESERALTYIEERAGTEFEPEAATAFVTMMRKAESGIQLSPMPEAAENGVAAPPTGAADAAGQQAGTTPVLLGKTPQGTI
ncbi:MAG TPA: HD domain-containing phosphohydrolase [Gemmatimonadaceae bacterium]|jgi:putative nucleotidyltransferase with HDIG domain|nr:HD domain-containing phosphohydrolase [Gemmatimonadaceae bacterium]